MNKGRILWKKLELQAEAQAMAVQIAIEIQKEIEKLQAIRDKMLKENLKMYEKKIKKLN